MMMGRFVSIIFAPALLSIFATRATSAEADQEAALGTESSADTIAPPNGFSGLAQVDGSSFLAVHDHLVCEDGSRLTLINVRSDMAPTYFQITIQDWIHTDGQSSDLEAICALPARPNQFILAEAGYWEKQYGRPFHIKLDAQRRQASVLGISNLPLFLDNNSNETGDQ